MTDLDLRRQPSTSGGDAMKLHDYQVIASEHLHRNPRSGLFLDMGL